jgi:hypothetical protein
MTLQTIAAGGRSDILGNAQSSYLTVNAVSGEAVYLEPCSDGQFSDYPMRGRYGHQLKDTDAASIGAATGIASWRLGSRSNFIVLSAADAASLYTTVNAFASSPTLASPVWINSPGNERIMLRQSNNAAVLRANPTAQLEIVQGGVSVFLTAANCSDLATQLQTIGAT